MKNATFGVVMGVGLLATSTVVHAMEYTLALKGLGVRPGERIVGLDIKVKNATLVAVARFPNGWTFNIETDPAGDTEIKGTVIVGAAALAPGDVESTWKFRSGAGPGDGPPRLTGVISVTRTFDDYRDVPLNDTMLLAKPSR